MAKKQNQLVNGWIIFSNNEMIKLDLIVVVRIHSYDEVPEWLMIHDKKSNTYIFQFKSAREALKALLFVQNALVNMKNATTSNPASSPLITSKTVINEQSEEPLIEEETPPIPVNTWVDEAEEKYKATIRNILFVANMLLHNIQNLEFSWNLYTTKDKMDVLETWFRGIPYSSEIKDNRIIFDFNATTRTLRFHFDANKTLEFNLKELKNKLESL